MSAREPAAIGLLGAHALHASWGMMGNPSRPILTRWGKRHLAVNSSFVFTCSVCVFKLLNVWLTQPSCSLKYFNARRWCMCAHGRACVCVCRWGYLKCLTSAIAVMSVGAVSVFRGQHDKFPCLIIYAEAWPLKPWNWTYGAWLFLH